MQIPIYLLYIALLAVAIAIGLWVRHFLDFGIGIGIGALAAWLIIGVRISRLNRKLLKKQAEDAEARG